MLRVALVFSVLALIAALVGFGSAFGFTWDRARIVFFVFAVLAVLSVVAGAYRRRAYLN